MRGHHLKVGSVILCGGLLLMGCVNTVAQPMSKPRPTVPDPQSNKELPPREFERIPPGLVIGDKPPEGWSHIVSVAMPNLGAGDVDKAPGPAAAITNMFWPAILANVKKDGQNYMLEAVAIGYALPVGEQRVIGNSENRSGAKLGVFGGRVLAENEKFLDASTQPAYTATMQAYDIPGLFVRDGDHKPMLMRHAVLVNPKTGELMSVLWLLEKEGDNALAEAEVQVLPSNFREDRVLNVRGDKITFGIPSNDAFAQVKIGQGRGVKWTAALKKTAGLRTFTTRTAGELETALREVIGDKWR